MQHDKREFTRYEAETVLPRLIHTPGLWHSASELCVTPESLKNLWRMGHAERYHDGRRWRYKVSDDDA